MIKVIHTSNWSPDFIGDSILDIDSKALKRVGISHIVFDLDNTLVRHGSNTISQKYLNYLNALQKAGFTTIIGSNTRRDIRSLAAILNSNIIVPSGISYKPFPSFYRRIVTTSGTNPKHIAMVGDNVLNDIIGANHAGFTTILVNGLRSRTSPAFRLYFKLALRHASHSMYKPGSAN